MTWREGYDVRGVRERSEMSSGNATFQSGGRHLESTSDDRRIHHLDGRRAERGWLEDHFASRVMAASRTSNVRDQARSTSRCDPSAVVGVWSWRNSRRARWSLSRGLEPAVRKWQHLTPWQRRFVRLDGLAEEAGLLPEEFFGAISRASFELTNAITDLVVACSFPSVVGVYRRPSPIAAR